MTRGFPRLYRKDPASLPTNESLREVVAAQLRKYLRNFIEQVVTIGSVKIAQVDAVPPVDELRTTNDRPNPRDGLEYGVEIRIEENAMDRRAVSELLRTRCKAEM